jgi:CRP-like cAMP-binding protein
VRKALYLLGQLNDGDVEWLIARGARVRVPTGETLIEAGRPVGALYVVLDGSLTVSVQGLDERDSPRMVCGEVAGEMSFVDARPPSATVTAAEPAVVLAVPRAELAAKLERDPEFAARFYRSLAMLLSHRLRALTWRVAHREGGRPGGEDEEEGELDPNVLDRVHLAGLRFEQVLQRLLG